MVNSVNEPLSSSLKEKALEVTRSTTPENAAPSPTGNSMGVTVAAERPAQGFDGVAE